MVGDGKEIEMIRNAGDKSFVISRSLKGKFPSFSIHEEVKSGSNVNQTIHGL